MGMQPGRATTRAIAIAVASAALIFFSFKQVQARRQTVGDDALREYTGTYQWNPDAFLYLELWGELSGTNQLVAVDESGEVRALYPGDHDNFTTGPGAAVAKPVESKIAFQRDASGKIVSLTWARGDTPARVAKRVDLERVENVEFSNGDIRLSGTLRSPKSGTKHPAIILVHASGAEDREYLLPLTHFLVRHGVALLGYDKRGVGQSTGGWRNASFDDLAGDVVSAFDYLKTRKDIDSNQIGLFGWSQAGWIMPLAAVRAKGLAFLISISGAAIPAAETTIDQARNEMTAAGMKPEVVDQIIHLMQLQYQYARTGEGWEQYLAARRELVSRLGRAPASVSDNPSDPSWTPIRKMYFYDPAPTLQNLRVPVLAIFGEHDNNILAEKNKAAWETHLRAAGNSDYSLRVLPKANHLQLEAKTGSNAEMASLQRFVPEYFETIRAWLKQHLRCADPATCAF